MNIKILKGLTFIIVLLLIGGYIEQVFFSFDKKKLYRDKADYDAHLIKKAIIIFYQEERRLPESNEGIIILVKNEVGFFKKVPVDLWGNIYLYEKVREKEFIIGTYGADKKIGGIGHNADYFINYILE